MPQVLLAPVAMAAFNATGSILLGNAILGVGTIGAITHAVVGTGVTIGVSLALSRWLNPQLKPTPSRQMIEIREPMPPLRVIYGRMKVGCPLGFAKRPAKTHPSDNPNYWRTCIIAGHEIDGYEAHYLNDIRVEDIAADGEVLDDKFSHDGNHYVYIRPYLGTVDQLADELMMARFPGTWTSEHRGRSIAYVALNNIPPDDPADFVKVFPNGAYEYQGLVRGKKLYDPTKDSTNGGTGSHRMDDPSTWEWSEEHRLVMLDFLCNSPGYNKGFGRMDWPSWIEQILMGRQEVPLAAGGSEARYRISIAWYPATDSKSDIWNRILLAGDARIFFTSEGKIGCRGGEWVEPTISLDLGEAAIDVDVGAPDIMDTYNVLRSKFLSPPNEFVEQEMDPWREEDRIEIEGERSREIDLTHVPSHTQARRLCKIYTRRDNPKWQGSVKVKLHGLEAVGEDHIDIVFNEFDGGTDEFNGPFRVDGEITLDVATETVSIPLKSADPTAYDWDTDDDGIPPIVPGSLTDDLDALLTDDADQQLTNEAP